MCFKQRGDISIQNCSSLKLVDKFTYLGSSVSSTEKDINTRLTKAWIANDRLSVLWKSDRTDEINRSFSKQRSCSYCYMGALHGRSLNVWRKSLTEITQECCEQHWTSLGGSTPKSSSCTATYYPSQKTIQDGQTRHAGHYWRSMDELISDILPWTPSHGRAKVGRPARTYI